MDVCNLVFAVFFALMTRKEDEIIEIVISELDLYLINKVREMRDDKDLSQNELSVLMHLADGAVGKIENPKERAKYNIRHINLLAKAFNCSPREFLPEKALSNDIIKATIRIKRNKKKERGKPNFDIISMEPYKKSE